MKSDDLIYRNTPDLYARYMRANPLYFEGLFRVTFSERNLERAVEMMFPGRRKAMRRSAGQRESLPGTEQQRAARGHVKGTCINCGRGPFYLNNHLCRTCERAAGSFIGRYRDEALEEIRNKIQEGNVMPRGKNSLSKGRTACENCGRDNLTLNGRHCTTCSKAAAGLTGEERIAALVAIREKLQAGSLRLWGKHRHPNVAETETGSLRLGTSEVVEDRYARLRRMVEEIEALGCEVTISLSISIEARP